MIYIFTFMKDDSSFNKSYFSLYMILFVRKDIFCLRVLYVLRSILNPTISLLKQCAYEELYANRLQDHI